MPATINEANALGFPSLEACEDHQKWLDSRHRNRCTVFARVVREGEGLPFHLLPWTPWISSTPQDRHELVRLILNRWIRDRGGLVPGDRFSVTVYTYDGDTPTHEDGSPMACDSITFTVSKD